MAALSEGTFEKYDWHYKNALNYASETTIPNLAYDGMLTFIDSIDEYMDKNWFQKIISPSPYRDFLSYYI